MYGNHVRAPASALYQFINAPRDQRLMCMAEAVPSRQVTIRVIQMEADKCSQD